MTSLAARERTLLCAEAQQLGPDAPTLCGEWTVRDLVAHLLVRESSPLAVGIVLPPLASTVDAAVRRRARDDFASMVTKLRHGPPVFSPFGLPGADAAFNLVEFFIHHEDLRRAQDGWTPRALTAEDQDVLWRAVGVAGRLLALRAPVPVTARRTDTRAERRLGGRGASPVTVAGLPSEVLLFLHGRQAHADVELEGDPEAVTTLRGASLGI